MALTADTSAIAAIVEFALVLAAIRLLYPDAVLLPADAKCRWQVRDRDQHYVNAHTVMKYILGDNCWPCGGDWPIGVAC